METELEKAKILAKALRDGGLSIHDAAMKAAIYHDLTWDQYRLIKFFLSG